MPSVSIFKNGSFNADAMIDSFNFSSWKTVKEASAQGDWPSINQLSQYFRTGNCLATLMYNGLKFSTIADSHIRREGSYSTDFAGGVSYIPIKRIYNPKIVTFKSRIYQKKSNGYNQGYFGVSQVNVSNEMVSKGSRYIDESNSSSGATFTERTIALSDVDYIDYIYMQWYDGTEEFMDISIYYEPLEIANGGGATHIAKVSGKLSELSNNLSDILLVSGGGGGGYLVGDGSINPDYVFSGANQTFATTNSTTEGNRPFTKENAGDAIAFMYYESTSVWYGPALISKIENATYFNLYNQYFQRDSVSAVIDGETWYVSKPGLWCHYPDSNPNWNLPVLRGHDYTTDWVLGNEISASNVEKLIRKVLQLAKGIYDGEEAGGMQGSGSNSGTQSTGNAFGQGESADNNSCGGGGYYGGYKRGSNIGAGAGSGYIGNSNVGNKKMIGYDILTSDVEATKTESVLVYSSRGEADKPKAGNGKAKITLVTPTIIKLTSPHTNCYNYLPSSESGDTSITGLPTSAQSKIKTDEDILTGQYNAKRFTINASDEIVFDSNGPYWTTSQYYIWLGGYYQIITVRFKYKKPYIYNTDIVNNVFLDVLRLEVSNNQVVQSNSFTMFVGDSQVAPGVVSDYVDVELGFNSWANVQPIRNYICLVSMNNKCYIKDLEFDVIPVDI